MSDENKIPQEETVVPDIEETKTETGEIRTDNEEIKDFNREVLGKPDSPLVVHKKGDASYEEDTSAFEMNQTHTEEEKPTLQRHRFKKEDKSKAPAVLAVLIVLVIIAGIFAGLYYTDHLPFMKRDTSTTQKQTTVSSTVSLQEKYAGTIVVKNVYIFVDGEQVDGLEGLQQELKYEEKSETAYKIINEHANADFLNFNVLPLLEEMGFYGEKTTISHVDSTGLIAYEETTTAPPETTTKKSKKKSKDKKKSDEEATKKDKQG